MKRWGAFTRVSTLNQELIKKAILNTPKSHGKYAAENAIETIERAWELKDIDIKASAFLGITAEEESVASNIHALKRRHYSGASSIKHTKHEIKAMFYPFCSLIFDALSITRSLSPRFSIIDIDKTPRVIVYFDIENTIGKLDPPLEMYLQNENRQLYDFKREIGNTPASNYKSIFKWARNIGDIRKNLLYASWKGIMYLDKKSVESFLIRQKERVYNMLILFLAIDPYPQHQLLAQQSLNQFLKIITRNKIDNELNIQEEDTTPTLKINLNTGKVVGEGM